jgi:hypothetical protein
MGFILYGANQAAWYLVTFASNPDKSQKPVVDRCELRRRQPWSTTFVLTKAIGFLSPV